MALSKNENDCNAIGCCGGATGYKSCYHGNTTSVLPVKRTKHSCFYSGFSLTFFFNRALVPFSPMLTVLIAVILIHLHAQPMDVVGTILR
jgi:hypothetical protein